MIRDAVGCDSRIVFAPLGEAAGPGNLNKQVQGLKTIAQAFAPDGHDGFPA